MRILVVRLSSMGDVILAASLFSRLKHEHPGCEIHFITYDRYKDFFIDDPRLSGLTAVAPADMHSRLAVLAQQPWDLLIDLQDNRRSRRMRKRHFRHIPIRCFNKLHAQRALLLVLRINKYKRENHITARYVAAAGDLIKDKATAAPLRLYFSAEADAAKRRVFGSNAFDKPILALLPFSAWKNKQWPAQSYAAVGKHFASQGFNVAVCGGPNDAPAAEKLALAVGGQCVSCAGKISLHELGSFLGACRLALGGDTGLTHLARACGVRSGIIYGSTTWHFGFFPFGEPRYHIFQADISCRPCHAHGGNICWRLSRLCLKMISVKQVIEGMEELAREG